MTIKERTAGILMPISSLPSNFGIGTFGDAAYSFVDFLAESGQSYWQILPLCPTGYGDSPYQSFSSYAGNPYFIDLDILSGQGYLEKTEYNRFDWGSDPTKVDYYLLYKQRFTVLEKAVNRLQAEKNLEFFRFCEQEHEWLTDYAVFMAIKDEQNGIAWYQWPEELRDHTSQVMAKQIEKMRSQVTFWQGIQFFFYKQWTALKKYANNKGIQIIGDLPIYVSPDSVEVWANPEFFQLDDDLLPKEIAGCPPDGYSAVGQLWGNPLFDWREMRKEGYGWWIRRIAFQFRQVDLLRIDHFRGFDSYFSIPRDAESAAKGIWKAGPGIEFFQIVQEELGQLPIIAEDLGYLTPSVKELLAATGFPGMKVIQFAFDSLADDSHEYYPYKYKQNSIAYFGTHDNDTIHGWFKHALPEDVETAKAYCRIKEDEDLHWQVLSVLWATVSDLAIVQMQDLLGLGSQARMNIPSTPSGNWTWRASAEDLNSELAQDIYQYCNLYGRVKNKE